MPENETILLVLPVPVYSKSGELFVENQAAHGLDLWAENFRKVTYAASVAEASEEGGSVEVRPQSSLRNKDRIEIIPLPKASGLSSFIRSYGKTREILKKLINAHEYLSFGAYWHVGDWPAVAALEAIKQKRKFSIWKDIVDHEAHLRLTKGLPFVPSMKARLDAAIVKLYHHHLISKSTLGLFHGADCFRAYGPICSEPHLVHDVTLTADDQIDDAALNAKIAKAKSGRPLRIVYAGRVAPQKGPIEWIGTLKELKRRGVPFGATWYGDGQMLGQCCDRVLEAGLEDTIKFSGFVRDRQDLISQMRSADVFVFCHNTPESPRCLIEALKSGLPLVGFESDYVKDLTAAAGGGIYRPVGDIKGLADELVKISADRTMLAELISKAAESGEALCDEEVFNHRSELIKAYS